MANYGKRGERAWWEVLDLWKEVLGEHKKGYKEQDVEQHGAKGKMGLLCMNVDPCG